MKTEYIYDSSKRMWYRHASSCHGVALEQKMLFQGKPVKEGFKLQNSTRVPVKKIIKRKWYQLWKPKYAEVVIGHDIVTTHENVQFRYYCTDCGKQNNGVWDFIHEDSSPKLNPNRRGNVLV